MVSEVEWCRQQNPKICANSKLHNWAVSVEETVTGDWEHDNTLFIVAKYLVKLSSVVTWKSENVPKELLVLGKLWGRMLISWVGFASCMYMICYHKRDELRKKLARLQGEFKGTMGIPLSKEPTFPDSYRVDSIKLRESWKRGSKERAYSWELVLRKNFWRGYSWETEQKPKEFLNKGYSKETTSLDFKVVWLFEI